MAGKTKNILLLGATFNTDNLGVGALAAGALTILVNKYPDAAISFLDYGVGPVVTRTLVADEAIAVPLVNLRFSWRVWLPNNVISLLFLALVYRVDNKYLGPWAARRNRWLQSLNDAELAFAVSGGDSFSDIYGLGRFFYVALPQILVLLLGKRLVLLPQTMGPFNGLVSRVFARFILKRAEVVFSRDLQGLEGVREILGPATDRDHVRFSHDMGFVLEASEPRQSDLPRNDSREAGVRPLVGLNVSGLLSMGGYEGNNSFGLKCDYRLLIDRLIAQFIEKDGSDVILVPHVFGVSGESDVTATARAYDGLKNKYTGRLFRLDGSYSPGEIKYIIGLCDFFVGARMHACIAALSQSVPAVGIAYSRKFFGVLQSIGVEQLVADPRRLTIEEILDVVGRAYSERGSTKEFLQRTMPGVHAKTLSVLDDIR